MSVAAHHLRLLDACVSDAFNGILKWRRTPASTDDAIRVGRAIEAAVHATLLRCYNAWNEAHPDPLLRLPRELVLDCFELLDFNGRKAVSHVSRAWRNLALSDPRLWNTVSLKQKRSAVALDVLTKCLQRSDPMPFALSSTDQVGTVSRPVLDVIIKNMHRMESIKFDSLQQDDLALLFSARAPVLRTFVYRGRLDLSSLWSGDMAPRLQDIDVRLFSVSAAFRPIASVRKFAGNLRTHHAPPQLLFNIFPHLTSLVLRGVTQQTIINFGPLIPSVTSLSLHSSRLERTHGVDYASILPTLSRLHLSTLFVNSASTVTNIVQLFIEKTHGERRIHIPWRSDVQMHSDTGNVSFTVNTSHLSLSLEKEPGLLVPLRAFSELSLNLELLVELHGALPKGDRSLPNVRSLTIILDSMDEFRYLAAIHERGTGGPIDAPHLVSLSFTVRFVGHDPLDAHLVAFGTWLGAGLPDVLPLVVSYPKENVSSVTMQAEDTELLAECGANNLRCLASRLSVPKLKVVNTRTQAATTLSAQ